MEKRIFYFFLLFTIPLLGFSQSQAPDDEVPHCPILKEGKQWVYEHHIREDEVHHVIREIYTLTGDTIIGNLSYKKLYSQDEGEAPVYRMALREHGTTVYRCMKNTTNEIRHIEFNPNYFSETDLGEFIGAEKVTDLIDTVEVNNRLFIRHRYSWENNEMYPAVEGIGFWGGILTMSPAVSSENFHLFSACYEGGKCIFTKDDFDKLGIEADVKTLETRNPRKSNPAIFDLQGRCIQGEPKHGVYIQNGKKVMR